MAKPWQVVIEIDNLATGQAWPTQRFEASSLGEALKETNNRIAYQLLPSGIFSLRDLVHPGLVIRTLIEFNDNTSE